jgi:tetratricopeptide (TPR) repeat protein
MKIQPGESAALLGAGVSVDAGAPTALVLADHLVDCLVHRDWAAAEIKRLARLPRPDARDRHDAIRFEMLLLWIGDVFDENLSFLSFLDDLTEPGGLHLRFAHAAIDGLTIVTTNFDDLLERAVGALGHNAHTVDAHDRRRPIPASTVPILKLHGSRQWHRSGTPRRSSQPLHATIETIAATNPGTRLNDRAEEALRTAVDGRTLVVAGYSGSDDLDVVPTLGAMQPARVVWIEHTDGPRRTIRARPPSRRSPPWHSLTWRWAQGGAHIEIHRGSTPRILDALGLRTTLDPAGSPSGDTWRSTIRQWASSVRHHDPTGLGFAGLLFGELGRYELAERALRESRGSRRADAGWSSARREYELGQASLLRPGGDLGAAIRHARSASKRAAECGDDDIAVLALLLEGRAAFLVQDWPRAEAAFRAAALKSDTALRSAYCDSWLGRSLQWQGETTSARRLLRRAIRAFERAGELEGQVDALHALAMGYAQQVDLDRARATYLRADEIAELLGFVDRRMTAQQALGAVAFDAGNLDLARFHTDEALSLARSHENDEVSDVWLLDGDIRGEQGDWAGADRSLITAIRTTTVITRDRRSEILAGMAHARLLLGRQRGSAAAVRRVWSLPESDTTWWGIAHALAVGVALGQRSLEPALRTSLAEGSPQSVASKIRCAVALTRLGTSVPEAEPHVRSGRNAARRFGLDFWTARISEPLDHERSG